MAYSFLLQDHNGTLREIPFSGHRSFHSFWLPLFDKPGLDTLLNLQFSHNLDKEELAEVITQLKTIKVHLPEGPYLERVTFVIAELELLDFNDYNHINFG
jgi:hypothetical protein